MSKFILSVLVMIIFTAADAHAGYLVNSVISPTNSVITPTNSVMTPTNSVITPTNSVITPTDSVIHPTDSVIHQNSSNMTCPDITIPHCGSDAVAVNMGTDVNGCNLSPQCISLDYIRRTQAIAINDAMTAEQAVSTQAPTPAIRTGYRFYQ